MQGRGKIRAAELAQHIKQDSERCILPNNQNSRKRIQWRAWAAWGVLALVVYFINSLVPKLWDDWHYGRFEWSDMLQSAYREYFTWNGRYFGCVFARVMGRVPDAVADVLATGAFISLLLCMVMHATGKKAGAAWRCWPMVLVLWFIIVLISPVFGECFLWHCGVAYYLFPFVLTMLFLLPYRTAACQTMALDGSGEEQRFSTAKAIGVCLLAIPAGWSVENMGIVTALSALAAAVYAKGSPNRKVLLVAAFIALACWVMMYLSPGARCRVQCVLQQHAAKEAGQVLYESSGKIVTFWEKIYLLAKPHLRTLPLYIVTLVLSLRLCKKGLWNRRETLFFAALTAVGLMCQGAFFGTNIAPATRAEQVTFLFIGIPCLRVIWLSYQASNHPRRWNAAIILLALLPCMWVPNLMSMNRQLVDYRQRLETAMGKGQEVVLPYWDQECDPVFGFIGCFVSSASKDMNWNQNVAREMQIPSVIQDNRMYFYEAELPSAHISAVTRQTQLGPDTSIKVALAPQVAAGRKMNLYIAVPISKKQRLTNLNAFREWFSPRTGDIASGSELTGEGHSIVQFEIPANGVVEWEKSYWSPSPEFWFAVSEEDSPDAVQFHRIEPTRAPQ